MLFVNFAKYGPDRGRIDGLRAAHLDYADALREHGNLAAGGPLIDDRGVRVGLLFIYEAASGTQATAFVTEDPFVSGQAIAAFKLSEWRLRGLNPELLVAGGRGALDNNAHAASARKFVNHATYTNDAARIAAVRPEHGDYARALRSAGQLALAGPFADDVGALFVYQAGSMDEAAGFIRQDPFAKHGVFARFELLEWIVVGINPDLFLKSAKDK